ncbi:Alpha/Beta hydrolase protein [Diplogelasinospora grovesii]|uniref:Alpha/Beta hydrolase protein n=1 Tax=Diplogelasinospora grovesii TaxID=303347 RepID=A0AAN6N7Y1_9PEZI|nr:Alpha/Beta hydrolase protein [Diplogelasinospora grovesii]
MSDTNPNLIQEEDNNNPSAGAGAVPLVLIHDGGGTVFSYHLLGPLNRALYGIWNPCYYVPPRGRSRNWESIPEMAEHYITLITKTLPFPRDGGRGRRRVILGGWSLGGLLSLEIAHQIATQSEKDIGVDVLGIVMVDSICPLSYQKNHGGGRMEEEGGYSPISAQQQQQQPSSKDSTLEDGQNGAEGMNSKNVRVVQHAMEWSPHTRPETREAVTRCFSEAGRMVSQWKLPPQWADDNNSNEQTTRTVNGQRKNYYPGWSRSTTTTTTTDRNGREEGLLLQPPPPPPVILLRCAEPVPVVVPPVAEDGDDVVAVSRVDLDRRDPLLGWGRYRPDLITRVEELPGVHHFNIFTTAERLDIVTEKIKRACFKIESMAAKSS